MNMNCLRRSACVAAFVTVLVIPLFAASRGNSTLSSQGQAASSGGPVLLDKGKDEDAVYKIVYELNGGTQNQANVDFYSGNKDVPLANPTRSGYIFAGWWSNPNGTGRKVERIAKGSTGEKKLYALWKMDNIEGILKNDSSMLVTAIPLGKVCRVDGLCNSEDVETLDAFAIGKYEVTQSLYYTVMGKNPSKFASSPVSGDVQDQRPVESVSYDDAIEFCNALSELAGREKCYRRSVSKDGPGMWECDFAASGYRLPTEAEWEFAARGGLSGGWDYSYSGSNSIYDVAWFYDNAKMRTHQVGKKRANSLGLYDMSGNVWEWCWNGKGGTTRGGSGGGEGDLNAVAESFCKVYFQNTLSDVNRPWTGFRICRTLNAASIAQESGLMRGIFSKPIHSEFSYSPSPEGLDFMCPQGTKIYAALAGKVSAVGYNAEYGYYVIVSHHSGYQTLYGHMKQSASVKVGQSVSTYTVLGYVGSTGMSTGPHLHFEVYKDGKSLGASNVLGSMGEDNHLSRETIAEATAGTGVYWTEHDGSFHLYEDCRGLDRTETLTTGVAQEAIDAGKDAICSLCESRYKRELAAAKGTLPSAVGE